VIGVATLIEVDGQNLNFAIPVESVRGAIASLIAEQGKGGAGERQPQPSPRKAVSLAPRTGGPNLYEFVREFVTAGNSSDPQLSWAFMENRLTILMMEGLERRLSGKTSKSTTRVGRYAAIPSREIRQLQLIPLATWPEPSWFYGFPSRIPEGASQARAKTQF
jgi:hypothetical protein